ncbi:MAG: hypothetical protein KDC92_15790 [Bacteroidetes bacterium]|nr:hypothetical protein [Bacteroidota bacterium]
MQFVLFSCNIYADFEWGEDFLEDEIDLRPYIDTIRQKWYLIVGIAIGFGALAYIISLFIAPTYQANTLILVRSSDIVQFDERFQVPFESQSLRTLPELAISDNILQTVLRQLSVDNIKHVDQLRQLLKATTGSDPSAINLTVSYQDPMLAAQIASIWSNVFVEKANNIYYDFDGGQLQFYENKLIEAETRLLNAEDELIAFQATNRGQVISNTLYAYSQRQINILDTQANLTLLQQDTQALLTTLTNTSPNSKLSFAEQLMSLSIQLRLLNSESAVPILLQPTDATTLTTENRSEQVAILENMLTVVEAQALKVNEELAKIEPLILDLQQQLQIESTEYERLSRELVIAQNTHEALSRKVEEENITSQNIEKGITLASEPSVPISPISPKKISNATMGFLMGLILAIFAIVLNQWWQIYNQS